MVRPLHFVLSFHGQESFQPPSYSFAGGAIPNRGHQYLDDMIRTRQNTGMSNPGSRPGPNEAIQLFNYLTTMNSYPQSSFPPRNQNSVMATSYNFCPGMKDVPQWLKSLRLHKYTEIFMGLSYEEMLKLNEQKLEELGVTTGARGKILQSISKLRRRPHIIREMITQLDASKDPECRCPILHLRQFLSTPIRDYIPATVEPKDKVEGNCTLEEINDNNLPALLVMLLQKVQAFFINCRQGEISEEYALMLFKSHDLILSNEAFTENQKRRVTHMKKQAKKYVSPGQLKPKTPTPGAPPPPPNKCEFCCARDALVGPMPLRDVLPPSPSHHRVKEKKKETLPQQPLPPPQPLIPLPSQTSQTQSPRGQEYNRSWSRAPEVDIGEWNPAIFAASTSAFNMNNMAQYMNTYLQQLADPYQQTLLQLAQTGRTSDVFNYPATPQPQPQSQPAAHNGSQWNYGNGNSYAQRVRQEAQRPVENTLVQNNNTRQAAQNNATRPTAQTTRQAADLPGISYIPQYRSTRQTPATTLSRPSAPPTTAVPEIEKPRAPETRWPTALYNNADLESVAAGLPQCSKTADIWRNLPSTMNTPLDNTDAAAPSSSFSGYPNSDAGAHSSGYSSSASDRGSGAGSPRAPTDVSDPNEIREWNTWDPSMNILMAQSWCPSRC